MIATEMRNPKTMHIDRATTREMLEMINEENYNSVRAVEAAIPMIERAVEAVTRAISSGHRLIYIGAGTSGRLAVVDASECPPTYGVSYDVVSAIMAGGYGAIVRPSENVEDNGEAGVEALREKKLVAEDVVMGISASGNAEFVSRALEYAKGVGCTTVSLASNPDCAIGRIADIPIFTDTGAEVITGSTRMKAGNAQKMVLNMISTASMIKSGKVYENMMINLRPTNKKLRERMIGITMEITGLDHGAAEALLEENEFSIPRAAEAHRSAEGE